MKIGLRGGHSINCRGAVGLRDEYLQMQDLYKHVRDILVTNGHIVIDCNSNANTVNGELTEGTNKANSNNLELYLTLHMNSYNGNAYGTEAWVYSTSRKSYSVAERLVNNYEKLGFHNRGVKVSTSLHDLRASVAPGIVFETCFCDSEKDINIWSPTPWEKLSRYICNAIDPNIPLEETAEKEEGYVVTDYLGKQIPNYDGAEVVGVIKSYFKDVDKVYVRGNSIGMWLETQLLPMNKCKELKERLGSFFDSIR
ncbi:N-acetylmuramoyl-L-alanine amidase [Clostridium hydrogeniformans]|uniref:N-acetylmuramoyl-L-alanine amidase n=1 Tax=Clostridium hydrogeniformans TaxID=349933 RepID=UPI000480F593|nr:N-acetylmuramoyl-L-alanine amidase [Clostridium hydrogeniformans]